jgi:ABC-type Fe3+/spermidine/putrescine transport system ATPase subunit
MSDRVMVMDRGRILQSGAPEDIYASPNSRFVADFVGQCNFLTAVVVDADEPGSVSVTIAGIPEPVPIATDRPLARGDRLSLALRPERIHFAELPPGTRAVNGDTTVTDESFLGDHFQYRLLLGDTEVLAQTSRRLVDPTARVWIDPMNLTIVDDEAPSNPSG